MLSTWAVCGNIFTIPAETPDALMLDARLMTKREFADLRSACEWNERRLLTEDGTMGRSDGLEDTTD